MAISTQTIRRITIQGEGQQSLDSLASSLDRVTVAQDRLNSASVSLAAAQERAAAAQAKVKKAEDDLAATSNTSAIAQEKLLKAKQSAAAADEAVIRAAAKVTAAENALGAAQKNRAAVTDMATKRTLSAEEAYRRQTLAVVDGARAQDQLAEAIRVADQYLAQGKITVEQHADRIALLKQKYGEAGSYTKALAAATGGLSQAWTVATGAAAAFGVTMGAAALVQYGKQIFSTTADLQEQADQVLGAGGNVEAFQALHATFLTNGISTDAGDKILQRLTRTLGDAAEGSKQAQDAFHKLGLGSKELAGTTGDQALPLVAQALLGIKDASTRAAIEVAVFGRSGQQLESALTALATPMDELIAREKQAGTVLDKELIGRWDDAKDQLSRTFIKLGVAIAPMIDQWVHGLVTVTNSISDTKNAIQELIDKVKEYGTEAGLAGLGWKLGSAGGLPGKIGGAAVGYTIGMVATDKQFQNAAATAAYYGETGINPAADQVIQPQGFYTGLSKFNPNAPSYTVPTISGDVAAAMKAGAANGNATPWATPKEVLDQYNKIKETYQGYLDEVTEVARLAGQTATQRETEVSVIKAAQIAQKEHNVATRDEVKNYADAAKYLGQHRTSLIEIAAAQKAVNQLGVQQNVQIAQINAGLAADADHRALVLKNLQDEIAAGGVINANGQLEVHLTEQQKQTIEDKNAAIQKGQDATAWRDYIDNMKDELSLAGLSADERERQAAVLQAMHMMHGNLTADQAREVSSMVQLRQETERWRSVVDGISGAFQDFFQDVLTTGKASFGSLWRAIEAQFAQMLAWMAAQALIQPIIIPMVEGVLGAGGLGVMGGTAGGGALSALGLLGNAGSAASMISTGANTSAIMDALGLNSMINTLGSGLGFASPMSLGTNLVGAPMSTPFAMPGSIFGSTTLSGFLGGAGLGALASSLIFGNKNDASLGGLGGAGLGAAIGSIIPGVGTIIGGLAGGLLGGGLGSLTGSSNQGSIINFNDSTGLSNYVFKQGGGNNAQLGTQAANTISDAIKTLQDAGVTVGLGNISGLSIGSDKSYVYDFAGGKQKLAGGDVEGVVNAILARILPGATGNTPEAQAVLAKYQASGGLTADNLSQFESDLGTAKNFADAVANLKASGEQLSQIAQQIKSINDQYDAAVKQAKDLGINTTNLDQARDLALQGITDTLNDNVQSALQAITNGPLAQWDALIKQQASDVADYKAAGADLASLEQLQYLNRKQLLMQLSDSERQSLENLIGLADDLAVKTTNLQATAIQAINSQMDAAKDFAEQERNMASQFAAVSATLKQAQVGYLVDPNFNRQSPADAYQMSAQLLDQAAAKANQGDLDALNSLQNLAQAFLNNSLSVNATSAAYFKDFDHVQDLLKQAQVAANYQQTEAEKLAALGDAQLTVLQNIVTELQKPDPNTAVLQQSIGQLNALNAAMGRNSDAVVSALTGPVAAQLDDLGGALTAAGIAQTAQITADLATLRAATADGLVTVAEAGPVRDALADLGNAVSGQLANQANLTQDQLAAALEAQAELANLTNTIGSGINVLNLGGVIAPLTQLVALTQQAQQGQQPQGNSGADAVAAAQAAYARTLATLSSVTQQGADLLNKYGLLVSDTPYDVPSGNEGYFTVYTSLYTDPAYSGVLAQFQDLQRQFIDAFQQAQAAYAAIPGHASGLDYVPYDNYLARLHRGERVQTAGEAGQYRSGRGAANDNSGALLAEIKAMRAEIRALRAASERTAQNTGDTADGVGQLHKTARNQNTRQMLSGR